MIKRLVKMTFREEAIPEFLENFRAKKEKIRGFPGCHHLELWQERPPGQQVFFTYSLWESEAALEAYRQSDLFRGVWAKTRKLFAARPEAWSLDIARVGLPGEGGD